MIERNKFDGVIDALRQINCHFPDLGLDESLRQICAIKQSFDIKVMVVGHFNAGKTALLNGLIERPGFLTEAQAPQTAIATELRYDESEQAFAYRVNGERETLTTATHLSPESYTHLEYRLPAPSLMKISDFTIVDTPGYDSNIEAHSKALANYIGSGSAFLVVVDQEKGGIDESTMGFLEEISHYSSQIAILINKCDKITQKVADEIASSVRTSLLSHGFNYPVFLTSKREPDISRKLVSIISDFQPQFAFDQAMKRAICTELVNLSAILSVMKQKIYLDTFDLDTEIRSYSRMKKRISEVFKKKEQETIRNLDTMTEKVMINIRSALISKADSVMEATMSGNQAATEAIIVETVRPIMVASVKDLSIQQIDDVVSELDFTGLVAEGQETLSTLVSNLAENLKSLIEQGLLKTQVPAEEGKTDRKKGIYRAVTGLTAIFTNFIAPWMEVIIILMPDIVSLLQGIFEESTSEKFKRRFINNVVPQLCNKMYPQVKQNIESATRQVLGEYQAMLNEKLTQLNDALSEAETKKTEKTEQFEIYKAHLNDDSVLIQNLLQQMR